MVKSLVSFKNSIFLLLTNLNNQTHSKCDIVSTNCVKNCCQHIFLFHTFKITKIGLFFNITQNYVPWIKKSKHKIVSYPALCCSTVCIVVCLHVQIKDHFQNDISLLQFFCNQLSNWRIR